MSAADVRASTIAALIASGEDRPKRLVDIIRTMSKHLTPDQLAEVAGVYDINVDALTLADRLVPWETDGTENLAAALRSGTPPSPEEIEEAAHDLLDIRDQMLTEKDDAGAIEVSALYDKVMALA